MLLTMVSTMAPGMSLGTIRLVNIGENRGGTAGQTEASLSVFTGATIPQLPSILVSKERTEFLEEPTPINLIVHDPS